MTRALAAAEELAGAEEEADAPVELAARTAAGIVEAATDRRLTGPCLRALLLATLLLPGKGLLGLLELLG